MFEGIRLSDAISTKPLWLLIIMIILAGVLAGIISRYVPKFMVRPLGAIFMTAALAGWGYFTFYLNGYELLNK
ncbi:hypothetical protein [Bacillus solitudinis]|uniref:hypothetical protein n=1 Tax=Bacillus solitudinis TaxID=2014074 RepID=UPI000C2482CD|nr:hypothetical protein [Bacillus solitudinis]